MRNVLIWAESQALRLKQSSALVLISSALVLSVMMPVQAATAFKAQPVDESFFKTPHANNPKLTMSVNFSFFETELSKILLVLARQADFNVVLPEKYDRKLTITIHEQRVIDAIEDVIELAGLSYQFKANSLIVSSKQGLGQFFESVPVTYYSAGKIVQALNEILFEHLLITQDPSRNKPNAVLDPSKNSIILFGDQDQVDAAKLFIKQFDRPPTVKIYQPVFVNEFDINHLIHAYFSANKAIEISDYEGKGFVLKGQAGEIKSLEDLLAQFDKPLEPVNFIMEIFVVKKALLDFFKAKNQQFLTTQAYVLNKEKQVSEEYTSLFNYMERIHQVEFALNRNESQNILGIKLSGERNLIDPKNYSLEFFNEELALLSENDHVIRLFGAQTLRAYPEIKALLKEDQSDMIFVALKAI
ncbi:MAG: hypothetical protein O3C63_00275 [Cyanobacteria bacterium]|nr:hypothetical protein [Cyanobacteriota bacterium]MDA1020556.1 hypothetical protein [Cyanobacteriota bacterium]